MSAKNKRDFKRNSRNMELIFEIKDLKATIVKQDRILTSQHRELKQLRAEKEQAIIEAAYQPGMFEGC